MYQEIDSNKYKSVVLIGLFMGLISAAGYAYGQYTGDGWTGLAFALGFSALSTAFTWFAGDKLVLSGAGARRIEAREQMPALWNLVENLCIAAGMPMPAVYLIDDPAPNAFATGRDPEHASIAVTTGLVNLLNKTELEGVIAHELSHVRNLDIRWMLLVAVLVGSLSLLGDLAFRFGGRRRDRSESGGPYLLIMGLVLLVLAPVFGQLIKFAISRQREYLADASGALLTRYPDGLAAALEKISAANLPVERAPSATAHLWIASPFKAGGFSGFIGGLFSTHPPIDDRIARLRGMIASK